VRDALTGRLEEFAHGDGLQTCMCMRRHVEVNCTLLLPPSHVLITLGILLPQSRRPGPICTPTAGYARCARNWGL
jgi:hypothetical protein